MNDMTTGFAPSDRAVDDAPPGDLPRPAPLRLDPADALFLDFDGTLAELADHPDAVVVASGLTDTIAALSDALGGRIAIVTGRTIAALETLTGPLPIAVAGSHGGEFRASAGAEIVPLAAPLPDEVVAVMQDFARDNGGLLVEPKPFSIAVHYRHHPEALDALLACAQYVASAKGLALKHGKQVIELTMPGSDKGSAVARFMGLPAFADATPIFLGDDVTDEDAFRTVARLGGHGVLVGPMRSTAAAFRLPDVAAVHAWLEAALHSRPEAKAQP